MFFNITSPILAFKAKNRKLRFPFFMHKSYLELFVNCPSLAGFLFSFSVLCLKSLQQKGNSFEFTITIQ